MAAQGLVARPLEGMLPRRDARAPVRVLIASLAPGGAERIVLEWLAEEAARGREVELAVLHARRLALAPPPGVAVSTRGRGSVEDFVHGIAHRWHGAPAPVSTHLVTDELLGILWKEGLRTVPVVHNSREGWRNDPACWDRRHVPLAVACAQSVREEMLAAGCSVPVLALRHRPRVGPAATNPEWRNRMRAELGIGDGTFLVGAVGAVKPQKDYPRAIEVLAALARRREAALVILGGILDPAAIPELERVLDAALELGVSGRLRLPGFVRDVEPYLAACDAVINVSRFEGLSMAVQEALAAGLPVVAADVGGQAEIAHPALDLLPPAAPVEDYARRLAVHPVRADLRPRSHPRLARAWSLTLAHRLPEPGGLGTLFVTANLNAGGAQRSLVNLACALRGRHRFAVAVCSPPTHAAFAEALASAGVEVFEAAGARDDVALAESVLAHAFARGCRTLCFWNAAPGVKLLATRFAPEDLRIVDASPGRHAFEEIDAARAFGEAVDWSPEAHYARLDTLVLKHRDPAPPPARRLEVVPNGVPFPAQPCTGRPARPRFLVSGRIAPSKRLEVILEAFALMRREAPEAELHVFGLAEPRHAAYAAALGWASRAGVHPRGPDFTLGYLAEPWTAAVVLGTHQGCPNAVLEAMAAGVPVVANASGGTGELVDAATGWLLAEDCTAVALARAMGEAWRDRTAREERGRAARERARSVFGMDAMVRRYLAILAPEAPIPHATIEAWNSASARAAPPPSSSAALPATTGG